MKKVVVAKPTAAKLTRKMKVWFGKCMLLVSVALVTVHAAIAAERHVYAKVFVDGDGEKYGYGYMRDVYLDVVRIPEEAVVEQDSGILFTDGGSMKPLSEIQTRALEFVKPHLKELGFKTVNDYKVFLYPDDKDKAHSDMATVQKLRADSFAIPSKFSGGKTELHGVWVGSKVGPNEGQSVSVDKETSPSDKKMDAGSAANQAPTQKKPNKTDSANAKAIVKEKQKVPKENKMALVPNQALTQKKPNTTDSANAKVTGKEKQKAHKENQKPPVLASKKAAAEKAKVDKKTEPKVEGKVVKEMIFGDFLGKNQAMTWCGRLVPQFLKSMATGNNKLISIGECSCKPASDTELPQQEFRCGFPVTYRVYPSNGS
jgi:hypothetical protein